MLWHEDWEIAIQDNERIIFADDMEKGSLFGKDSREKLPNQPDETLPGGRSGTVGPYSWKILVVDDNQDVQTVTQSVLRNFTFEGKPLQMLFASSGQEARDLASQHQDLALVLMDVVMENDHAGLDAVRFIRESLGNRFTRIVLRTGQPGFAPEEKVIAEYDINDYREKADLSVRQLRSLVTINLRNYRDLRTIQQLANTNQALDGLVRERSGIFEQDNRELSNQREELLRAQRIGRMGSWVWQIGSDQFSCSEEALLLLGVEKGEGLTLQKWLNTASPDWREKIRQTLWNAVDNGMTTFRFEHTIGKTGRWVRQQGEVVRHVNGHVLRVEGTILDISDWRRD